MMNDERRIADYARRLGWSLQRLDPADRAGLVDEIRSHLVESAAAGPAALDRALDGLGPPHALGRRFIEEYELAGAVAGAAPARLLVALLGRSSRRVAGVAAAFGALLCYLCTLIFAAAAMIKPFAPDHVGAWRGPGIWTAGIVDAAPASPEMLGLWVIPLALALALGCYLAGTLMLRAVGGRLLSAR